ncbi:STAS domain-containing protein [Streptomyces sp. NPDC059835]|uniref:STAS domain-containing protein n=1 Tax=Streptomyces sp. NPDC059835 TaxID=3346967 RepID=UPI00364D4E6D
MHEYPIHAHPHARPAPVSGQVTGIACEKRPDGVLVHLRGEFGVDTVHLITDAVRAWPADLIVIDLSQVSFTDSSLLHCLLDARVGHQLVLAGPLPHQLDRLFDITATRSLFTFAPDAE